MPNGEISILLNCFAVPRANRGFSATGKRILAPLSIEIIMWPSRKTAERALSVNMLMPLLNDKTSMLGCKLLRLRQLPDLEPL